MYPHTLDRASSRPRSGNTIRKNAILLPAYTLLLGLLALLGYMGRGAGLKLTNNNDVVPALFKTLFPSWLAGFAFAAIAIGALVPAAVMSIGAANLFTRNFWKAYVNPRSHAGGRGAGRQDDVPGRQARRACSSIIFLPTQFALDLQLLGGLWILQTLPALVFGLYIGWFRAAGVAGRLGRRLLRRNLAGLGGRSEAAPYLNIRRDDGHRLRRPDRFRGKRGCRRSGQSRDGERSSAGVGPAQHHNLPKVRFSGTTWPLESNRGPICIALLPRTSLVANYYFTYVKYY